MVEKSYSQYGQDRLVIDTIFKGKRGGYFVEAGGADGLFLSNTLLLEREFGWTGLLVEPTSAFEALKRNRPNCACDNACLAGDYKTVTMVEIFDRGQAEISGDASENLLLSRAVGTAAPVDLAQENSHWGVARKQYLKQAEPLAAVLKRHDAPRQIDYLSLDVEGFEYEILRTFPFDQYRFGCLDIERPPPELVEHLKWNGYNLHVSNGVDSIFLPGRSAQGAGWVVRAQ